MSRLPVPLVLLGLVVACAIGGQGAPVGAGVPPGSSGVPAAPQTRVDVWPRGWSTCETSAFSPMGQH